MHQTSSRHSSDRGNTVVLRHDRGRQSSTDVVVAVRMGMHGTSSDRGKRGMVRLKGRGRVALTLGVAWSAPSVSAATAAERTTWVAGRTLPVTSTASVHTRARGSAGVRLATSHFLSTAGAIAVDVSVNCDCTEQ